MSSPAVLDFELLLRPISDENPSGAELREDPALSRLFFQIKDACDTARTAEAKISREKYAENGDDDATTEEVSPPNWADMRDQAVTIIANHSKDLWIAAWLIEALARLEGFVGLRDGFRLTREMCEKFWDTIHPYPDEEDGIAWTVSQLAGLNGTDGDGALIKPISYIPITPQTRNHRPLSTFDRIYAETLAASSDLEFRAKKVEQGAVLPEYFDRAIAEASPEQFREILADIQDARDEFEKLTAVLDERCGKSSDGYHLSPPSSAITRTLEDVHNRVKAMTNNLLGGGGEGVTEQTARASTTPTATTGGGQFSGNITNRDEAFRALLKVAEFFRRTEPHSPVSYSVEQAVRWGKMSLPELMKDLIGDDHARSEMFRRAGIEMPDSSE